MESAIASSSAGISLSVPSSVLSSHNNCQECSDYDERKNEAGKDEAPRGRTITETTVASAVSISSSNNNDCQEPVDVASESTGDGRESPAPKALFHRCASVICRKPYNGNRDAIGFAFDTSTRGIIVIGGLFLVTALLYLAEDAAGCHDAAYLSSQMGSSKGECSKEINGWKPSSLTTSIQSIVAVISAVCMPLVGAIIDHTTHRRLVGQLTAVLLVAFNVVYIFLDQTNWFTLLLLLIPFLFTYSVHSTATFAYFPELTEDDAKTLYRYSASFTVIQFLSMILVIAIVVSSINLMGIQDDNVATAHFSQIIVVGWSTVFFGIAWTLCFSNKPTFSDIPEGSTLLTAGFKKLSKTLRKICLNYPAIKWYLAMIACVNSALPTVSTVVVTILAGKMNFTPTEIGTATMIVLLSTIPGSFIAVQMANLVNPKRSLQLSLIFWIVSIIAAALVLQGPEKKSAAYFFSVLLGINTGWFDPSERGFYVIIIPKNQDAEFMGIYISACQIIGWLPPLVFTAMNQAGIPSSIGLATLSLYILLGLLALSFGVPSYEESMNQAREQELEEQEFEDVAHL